MTKSEFFTEYNKLRKKFPYVRAVEFGNEASEYCDNIFRSRNCYYVFESAEMNECLYTADGFKEVNDVDCDFGLNGEGNCECIDSADSSNCYGSQSFARCYNVWYSWYLTDCHDCFGCANLSNKEYCIFNVQYTKEEYEREFPKLKAMPMNEVRQKVEELKRKIPQVHAEQVDNNNSDYCDYAYYNTNCYYCFDGAQNQDCGYITASYECKDTWDCNHVIRGERTANSSYAGDIYNCYEVTDCNRCYDSYYLEDCDDCHDCFGCTKLSNKQYCILNTQYTKEEYEQKVAELKKELGICFQAS